MESVKMKTIRFGATYGAPPIFCEDLNYLGYVNLNELRLSKDLIKDINQWDDFYQKTFCSEYPPDSSFKNKLEEEIFVEEGRKLAVRLHNELQDQYIVYYINDDKLELIE